MDQNTGVFGQRRWLGGHAINRPHLSYVEMPPACMPDVAVPVLPQLDPFTRVPFAIGAVPAAVRIEALQVLSVVAFHVVAGASQGECLPAALALELHALAEDTTPVCATCEIRLCA